MWKEIPGYEGYYKVSIYGDVESIDRIIPNKRFPGMYKNIKGKRMSTVNDTVGYKLVHFSKNGIKRLEKVHRLVGITFLANPYSKRTINHKDGDKGNNRLENLEWATHKENINHAVLIGLRNHKGEKNHKAKLKINDVLMIRELIKTKTHSEIAKMYNVETACVSKIKLNKTWRHI